jgi:hypothetical protein
MPGLEHTNMGWPEIFPILFVPVLVLAVVSTGAGGAGYWAVKGALPRSRLVRICMVLGLVVVVVVVGLIVEATFF